MVRASDLILVSVDDHICEPADMFDAHVTAKYRDRAPRVVDEPDGSQQWYYGDVRGRNLGLNAVAGKPPEMFNVNPTRYSGALHGRGAAGRGGRRRHRHPCRAPGGRV